jgi:hypothetical protein
MDLIEMSRYSVDGKNLGKSNLKNVPFLYASTANWMSNFDNNNFGVDPWDPVIPWDVLQSTRC